MAAGAIRVMAFPDGCVVETKLSQISAGSLLAFDGDVLFRYYDDVAGRYVWVSGGGDRFTGAGLREALSGGGALPVVLRYKWPNSRGWLTVRDASSPPPCLRVVGASAIVVVLARCASGRSERCRKP